MTCRDTYYKKMAQQKIAKVEADSEATRLLFGVDSATGANNLLQNNLTQYEWAVRNKVYPYFWGRNIVGEHALTKEEIEFLKGEICKIAPIYQRDGEKKTEEQGELDANAANDAAMKLGIPYQTAIFLEIGEQEVTRNYLRGYAKILLREGYTPGFRANTDAKYNFDAEYSRGIQSNQEMFEKCLIWAVAPSLVEFQRIRTTHIIHPDEWKPYAPSGMHRNEIAIWQYGKDCHPIYDDDGREVTFNINLVRNNDVINKKMI